MLILQYEIIGCHTQVKQTLNLGYEDGLTGLTSLISFHSVYIDSESMSKLLNQVLNG